MPWNTQIPENVTWTLAGVELVRAVGSWELLGKPAPGDTFMTDHFKAFHKVFMFTDQLYDRGLVTGGEMKPRKYFGGALFDFLFLTPTFFWLIATVDLAVLGCSCAGLVALARALWLETLHLLSKLYVLLHTFFFFKYHLNMCKIARNVAAYNTAEQSAVKSGEPNTVPKPFHLIMWAEQAVADSPRGSHPYDTHTWPPLMHIPPPSIPLYCKSWVVVDFPGIVLLLCGLPVAFLTIWGCYLSAGATDHLFFFGGSFGERIKTFLPIRGFGIAQYATWIVIAHLTSPAQTTMVERLGELLAVALLGAFWHMLFMLFLGAHKSERKPGKPKGA
mmetsp:Transcript_44785/g.74302  ORF Transcript_44785/g.74302 Transcript_44785/m.74302 type:complete len:332 (-) Transcript_44785:402-1397(-)